MVSSKKHTRSTVLGEFSGIALFAMQEYFKYNPTCDPDVVKQVWLEKANWFEMFGRPYKRPATVLT